MRVWRDFAIIPLFVCTVGWFAIDGNAQTAANDPAKHELLMKKEDLVQKIDNLKYQKAAMDPTDYRNQLTAMLLDLAKVQQELDK